MRNGVTLAACPTARLSAKVAAQKMSGALNKRRCKPAGLAEGNYLSESARRDFLRLAVGRGMAPTFTALSNAE